MAWACSLRGKFFDADPFDVTKQRHLSVRVRTTDDAACYPPWDGTCARVVEEHLLRVLPMAKRVQADLR